MFVRIYFGLIATILSSILVSYLAFSFINDIREESYNESIYSGTFKLIGAGLQRHQGAKRDEWLSIVARLSGIGLTLKQFSELKKPDRSALLKNGDLDFAILDETETYRVRLKIDSETYLEAELDSISEQQLRISLLLTLNELEGSDERGLNSQLERLQSYFFHPLSLINLENAGLDSTQQRRLKNGAIVVVLSANENAVESHSVYALLDKGKQRLLKLGPIPNFDDTPPAVVVILLLFNILNIGIVSYLMVRRLEKRLKKMSKLVNDFGSGELNERLSDTYARDSVSALAQNFNAMAERIAELIDDQKHMSQAISHELRTPIARMKFRLDILAGRFESQGLQGSEGEDQDNLEKIEGLKRDLKELNTLVDEALFFQQVGSMSTLVNNAKETVLLKPCVEEISAKLIALHSDRSFDLDIGVDVKVQANALFLRRLLQNLIANGLRHAKSKVCVRYQSTNDLHYLYVEDDGEGIEEEQREILFEPFKRAETSRNKKLGGYGLGLAIVRRIAELHHGGVGVDQSSLGGARFTFSWPIKDHV